MARGRGEGSIYQRADGRWCASISIPTLGGTSWRVTRYAATKAEAREKLQQLQRAAVEYRPPDADRIIVGQFLERWLRDTVCRKRDNTRRNYTAMVSHCAPLAQVRLAALRVDQVNALFRAKSAELAPSSLALLRRVLRAALNQAIREGLLGRNVAALTDPIQAQRRPVAAITPARAQEILAAVAGHQYAPLYVVILALGLRVGEALGLTWNDVDWESGTVRLTGQLQRQQRQYVRVPLKTAQDMQAAYAPVLPLPRIAYQALTDAREWQVQLKKEVWRDEWQNRMNLVFTTARGEPISHAVIGRAFGGCLKAAGLSPMRLHDLRHAAATILWASGANPKQIQTLLRHSTLNITLDLYTHVGADVQRQVAETMDAALQATPTQERLRVVR